MLEVGWLPGSMSLIYGQSQTLLKLMGVEAKQGSCSMPFYLVIAKITGKHHPGDRRQREGLGINWWRGMCVPQKQAEKAGEKKKSAGSVLATVDRNWIMVYE